MMNEIEKIINDIIESSRRNFNIVLLELAKLIKTALINNKHAEKPVSELEVLQKLAKEREKAIAIYNKANRKDLADKETRELEYIQWLMPKEPSEQEIEELIA